MNYQVCGEYLTHSGVPNQKWGVRRYQYPDGSYTEEGKARRRKGNGKDNENVIDGKWREIKENGNSRNVNNDIQVAREVGNMVNTLKTIERSVPSKNNNKEDLSEYSDEELRRKLNRIKMEQEYNKLSDNTVSEGRERVRETLEISGAVAGLAVSALTIYEKIKK